MRRGLATALLGVSVVACQTITEEMPSRPTGNDALNLPVLVVPALPPGSPQQPPPAPAPTPTPGPGHPTPEPPAPAPPPDGGGGDFPDNNAPVAKLGAKVYFVEMGGAPIAYPPAPVGSRIHLDVTPKDAANKPTRARGMIRWTFSRTDIIKTGVTDGNYNPTLTAKAPGDLIAYAEVDGIRSNNVDIVIR